MDDAYQNLETRLAFVERRLRSSRRITAATLAAAAVVCVAAWRQQPQSPDVIRARTLIIEDPSGHQRIILGAPVPDPRGGQRRSAATGLVINDSAGNERFGVGLLADGSVAMGFDAAPATGGARGGERLTLGVGQMGNGEIRFLDRASYVRAHMTLFNDNTVALFFTDIDTGKTIVHRVSARGDTIVEHRR